MAEKQREDQELFQLQQKALIEQQDNIQTVSSDIQIVNNKLMWLP